MNKGAILFVSICMGCGGPAYVTVDNQTPTVIRDAQSYEYDLKNELYKVYFLSKPPIVIKFHLDDREKKEIHNSWSEVKFAVRDSIFQFDDKCSIMPKIYTTISISSERRNQKIIIDEDCNDFTDHKLEATKIKQFTDKVRKIIKSKPEVLNVPASDIIYI